MRRTVKAWVVGKPGSDWLGDCDIRGVWRNRPVWADGTKPRSSFRVTVTYDDGRPAPRKRTKGKKGGR